MSKSAAWIMNIDGNLFASVSQMELVHIINDPYYTNIPGAPDYCQNVITWNDNILPVVDLCNLLKDANSNTMTGVVAVIIYRDINDEINYGGIILAESPNLEFVQNNQLCPLPDYSSHLHEISLSCFESKDGHKVPILDITKIFSKNYSLSTAAVRS